MYGFWSWRTLTFKTLLFLSSLSIFRHRMCDTSHICDTSRGAFLRSRPREYLLQCHKNRPPSGDRCEVMSSYVSPVSIRKPLGWLGEVFKSWVFEPVVPETWNMTLEKWLITHNKRTWERKRFACQAIMSQELCQNSENPGKIFYTTSGWWTATMSWALSTKYINIINLE